jgi:hypothetical protein
VGGWGSSNSPKPAPTASAASLGAGSPAARPLSPFQALAGVPIAEEEGVETGATLEEAESGDVGPMQPKLSVVKIPPGECLAHVGFDDFRFVSP